MNIITQIVKFFNEVLFNDLNFMMPFNKIHLWTMFFIFLIIGILIFVYRFLVYRTKTRRRFIVTMYILLAIFMAYTILFADLYLNNIAKNNRFNFIHLLYTILPLSIPYLSTIFLGIIIFSKKERLIMKSFVTFVTPIYSLISIVFYEKEAIIHNDLLGHFLINGLLILIPLLLYLLKYVKINFRSINQAFVMLIVLLIFSYILSITFEAIKHHSISSVVRPDKGMVYLYNYNYAVSPFTKYRFIIENGEKVITFNSSNILFKNIYNIISIPLLYLIIFILLVYGLFICIGLFLGKKNNFCDEYKKLIKKPIQYLFTKKEIEFSKEL